MHSAICLFGLVLAVVPAGAQQAKSREPAPVYAGTDAKSSLRGTLDTGDTVAIDMRLSGSGITWCSVTRTSPAAPLSGFVDCSKLEVAEQQQAPQFRRAGGDAVGQLLKISGFDLYVRHFTDPSVLETALGRDRRSPEARRQLMEVFSSTFRADGFLGPVRSALERTYSDEMAQAALAWYKSDLGRRITSLEADSTTAATVEGFQGFLRGLPNNPPAAARAALVDRLWHVADFSDLQLEMAVSVTRSVAGLLNPRLPPEKRITEEGLQQISTRLRQLRPRLAELGKARYLYVYRNFSDEDLEQYVRFWETPHGRWFRRGIYEGGVEAVRSFTLDFARAMIANEDQRRER